MTVFSQSTLKNIISASWICITLLGFAFLFIHFFAPELLKQFYSPMRLVTATCFIFVGFNLLLINSEKYLFRLFVKIFSILLLIITGLNILDQFGYFNFLDFIPIQNFKELDKKELIRMSLGSCFNFIIIASIFLLHRKSRMYNRSLTSYLILIPFFISLFALLCFLYNSQTTFFHKYTGMSLYASLTFILTTITYFLINNQHGWFKIATSPTSAGIIIRYILMPNLFIFPLAGMVRYLGEQRGYFNSAFGLTVIVTLEIIILTFTLILTANKIYELEINKENLVSELNTKNQLLSKVNNELNNFVYLSSHDLKAPINNIEGLLSHIENAENASDSKTAIDLMKSSVTKFKSILHDLGNITKVQEEGKLDFEFIDLQKLAEEILTSLQTQFRDISHVVHQNFKVSTIYFSVRNSKSILYNLISNSMKYRSPERKLEITLTSKMEKGFVVLSVKDNGLGINEIDIKKVFTAYHRFHPGIEGTGVGLVLVKRMVESGGGKIEVFSKEGVGTVFNIYLPNNLV